MQRAGVVEDERERVREPDDPLWQPLKKRQEMTQKMTQLTTLKSLS